MVESRRPERGERGVYRLFERLTLATGEEVELGVVEAPQPGDPFKVAELLAHKGGDWNAHIAAALESELDGLETRFYIAAMQGRGVCNVMTVEHAGVGILGHVFTRPEHRRKGLCSAVFRHFTPDFRARGGRRLTLGTGFSSPPYWIYHGQGFRSILPESGFMGYEAVDGFAAGWYRRGEAKVEPLTWRHWPTVAQLIADDFGDGLQSLLVGAFGKKNFEGSGLSLIRACVEGRGVVGRVLVSDEGAAVGYAWARPDPRWDGGVLMLDLLAHPNFHDRLPELLAALPLPAGKVQCCVPTAAGARRAALEACGFGLEAELAGQLPNGGDVALYARHG
jgi:hypothetical protein